MVNEVLECVSAGFSAKETVGYLKVSTGKSSQSIAATIGNMIRSNQLQKDGEFYRAA